MKTLPLLLKWAALMVLTLASLGARADDIDIYQGTPGGVAPNLLLILDNSAANSASVSFTCPSSVPKVNDPGTNFGFEQCGLYQAISAITASPTANLNLGLMYFPKAGINGGQFVVPATPSPPSGLLPMNSAGLGTMLTRVSQLSLASDKSNNNQVSQAMQEAWAFYQGKKGLSGTQYLSPGPAAQACTRNFVLYITLAKNNNKPQDGGKAAANALQTIDPNAPTSLALPAWTSPVSPFSVATGKYQSDPSPDWANFMYTGGAPALSPAYPSITTYTIILSDGSNPDYEQLMVSMANQGGGKYFVVDLSKPNALNSLVSDINQVFNEVQATNSVFASPTLPVSANTQGTYLNQIYMGMFRPDPNGNPRWMGNLKQYQVAVSPSTGAPFLADANGVAALSSAGTGFITPTATSFWSSKNISTLPDSKGGFWVNAISQQGGNDGYDAPDGQIVEKGGVGQQIRLKSLTDTYTGTTPTTSRNLYTCIGSCASGTALNTMPFNTGNTNLTTTALQIPTGSPITSANLPNFINWVRGEDTHAQVPDSVAGPESSAPPANTPPISIRGSVHGDVLHSRPAVINYGGSIGVVAFYGSNDGVFRAVNGNQTSAISMTGGSSSIPAGGELWGFVPPELYSGLQQVYQNSPALHLGSAQTSPPSASTSGKNYFFDGDTGVYRNTVTGTTYIFLSARRGGRLLYALDVTDPTNPKFLWKHTNTDPGFAELGQTWSQPKVAMVKGYTNPVLIFGAGYDPNEDFEPPNTDVMGRGIFVLDAVTGNLLWQAVSPSATCAGGTVTCVQPAGMNYAIPADVTLIDRNGDGLIDRLYAADLGGNIWRVDLQPDGTGALSTWQVTQFAALGGTGTTKRKFFFPPDVVLTNSIDLVSDVTGDREHPLSTQQANNIVNRFYMIQDTKVGMSATGWSTVTDNSSSTANAAPTATLPLLSDATSTTYLGSLPGYYVTLLNPGEKGVNAPLTVAGTVYFGTSQPPQPSSTSCTANLGTARSYQLSLLSGTKSISVFAGGGLAPSPVFAVVDVVVNGKTQQMPVLFGGGVGTGSDKSSSVGANNPFASISMPKKRTYWYRNIDH